MIEFLLFNANSKFFLETLITVLFLAKLLSKNFVMLGKEKKEKIKIKHVNEKI